MAAPGVVPAFNPGEDCHAGLSLALEGVALDEFSFQKLGFGPCPWCFWWLPWSIPSSLNSCCCTPSIAAADGAALPVAPACALASAALLVVRQVGAIQLPPRRAGWCWGRGWRWFGCRGQWCSVNDHAHGQACIVIPVAALQCQHQATGQISM